MNKLLKHRARHLRKNMTDAELKLWSYLCCRQLYGYKFRRQSVINHYIVDFICIELKLIIEVDGSQHVDNKKYDQRRTSVLNQQGYIVLRYWNNEVISETLSVIDDICQHIEYIDGVISGRRRPPSQPSPTCGGRGI